MPLEHASTQLSDFPALCASYDHGGGVGLGENFVIYTISHSQPHLELVESDFLKTLASNVARYVKIYYTLPADVCLHSLPHESVYKHPRLMQKYLKQKDRPQLPSFFVNAASSQTICIAGIKDDVTTLLGILRRPWCVLELCSVGREATKALLVFARAASSVDCSGYAGSAALLRYQLDCREGDVLDRRRSGIRDGGYWKSWRLYKGGRRSVLKNICEAVFESTLGSFNGFYIRAIISCAVEVEVGWAAMGRFLAGSKDIPTDLVDRQFKDCTVGESPSNCLLERTWLSRTPVRRYTMPSRPLAAIMEHEHENTISLKKIVVAQTSRDEHVRFSRMDAQGALFELYSSVIKRLAFDLA